MSHRQLEYENPKKYYLMPSSVEIPQTLMLGGILTAIAVRICTWYNHMGFIF